MVGKFDKNKFFLIISLTELLIFPLEKFRQKYLSL